jgi:hypothetical protein
MTDEEFYAHFRSMNNHVKILQNLKRIRWEESQKRHELKVQRIQVCAEKFAPKIPNYPEKELDKSCEFGRIIGKYKYNVKFGFESITISMTYSKSRFKLTHKLKNIDTFDFNHMINTLEHLETTSNVINA